MKKTFVALLLVVLFVLSIASPVSAQFFPASFEDTRVPATGEMTHSSDYEMDGRIDYRKQAGHICNTGAELKQVLSGDGLVNKTMAIHMVGGKITVDDNNELVTAPDAVSNLEITSVIELCAPPKSLFTEKGALYASLVAMVSELFFDMLQEQVVLGNITVDEANEIMLHFPKYLEDGVVPPLWGYLDNMISGIDIDRPTFSEEMLLHLMAIIGADILGYFPVTIARDVNEELTEELEKLLKVIEGQANITDPLTKQIWAASVSADPGHTATLSQDFEAAYGPWGGISIPTSPFMQPVRPADINNGIISPEIPEEFFLFGDGLDDTFWFDFADYPAYTVEKGPDYVGNYFNIEQSVSTTQGVTKRYIDISSPWNHGYLMEDMTVTGAAEISEAFSMENLEPGSDIPTNWWVLF